MGLHIQHTKLCNSSDTQHGYAEHRICENDRVTYVMNM